MWTDLNQRLKSFAPISLTQLNAQASFLDRIDVKYLMSEQDFEKILSDLEENFYILEINWKSIFEYQSIYMDTVEYDFYYQHQNKEKNRTKVRTRLYVDSGIAFFEYKQKQNKTTRKFRYQMDTSGHGKMTSDSKKFFEGVYQSMYGTSPKKEILPALETHYNRLTFCSKNNDERVTVDFNVKLKDTRVKKAEQIKLENVVILESKSTSDKCPSQKIMEKYDIKEASSCSKYSLWIVYSWIAKEHSVFDKTIKQIEKISREK
jgi:hypothetical protein